MQKGLPQATLHQKVPFLSRNREQNREQNRETATDLSGKILYL